MFTDTHTTAPYQGKPSETMLVAQMADEHLLNTIRMHVNKLVTAKRLLNNIASSQQAGLDTVDQMLNRAVYNVPKVDIEKAATELGTQVNVLSGRLQIYLLEAWSRKLSPDHEDRLAALRIVWQEAIGRNQAIPANISGTKLLTTANSSWYVGQQDDDDDGIHYTDEDDRDDFDGFF